MCLLFIIISLSVYNSKHFISKGEAESVRWYFHQPDNVCCTICCPLRRKSAGGLIYRCMKKGHLVFLQTPKTRVGNTFIKPWKYQKQATFESCRTPHQARHWRLRRGENREVPECSRPDIAGQLRRASADPRGHYVNVWMASSRVWRRVVGLMYSMCCVPH